MTASIRAVIVGTFTLRFSTGLTGAMLVYYLAQLRDVSGAIVWVRPDPVTGLSPGEPVVSAFVLGLFTATFFVAELALSPIFGVLSDRLGHHRVMQFGPIFGAVAVLLTAVTTNLVILGGTRWLEGASTAASVPSILGFIAMATAHDEGLRGVTSARFEAATIAGLGAGFAAAGPLWELLGPAAFVLNALFYMVSLAIYRFFVDAPDTSTSAGDASAHGIQRYARLLRTSHVWLLAPTWIAVNAALGLYTSQTLFQLVRERDPRFPDQLLVGGFSPLEVTAGFVVAGVVFFGGLVYWGNRFKAYRRTTIIFYGLLGGAVLVGAALALNHSEGLAPVWRIPMGVAAAFGLFVLAGATPAALGLLADISEAFPEDRGAIMGLYSVFLGAGQILGALVGGSAADNFGFDGILVSTLALMAVAVLPLAQLRHFEHHLEPVRGSPAPRPGEMPSE